MDKSLKGCKNWIDNQIKTMGREFTSKKYVNRILFKVMFVDCYMTENEVKELKKYINLKTV